MLRVRDRDRADGFGLHIWSYSGQLLANRNRHPCNGPRILQVLSRNKHTTGLEIKRRVGNKRQMDFTCVSSADVFHKAGQIALPTYTTVSQVLAEDNYGYLNLGAILEGSLKRFL